MSTKWSGGGALSMMMQDVDAFALHAAGFAGRRPGWLRRASILLTPPLMCCAGYRLSRALWVLGLRRSAILVARLNLLVHKAAISPASEIGGGLYVPHPVGIVLDADAGANLVLFANAVVSGAIERAAPTAEWVRPRLGDDVVVGAFAIVVGGVEVGSGARLGAGAVVDADVAPGAIVMRATRRSR